MDMATSSKMKRLNFKTVNYQILLVCIDFVRRAAEGII
jgi:hypothetical protein